MASKSANYCRPDADNPVGILSLCKVELGNVWNLTSALYVNELPKGKDSVKGLGLTSPDPNMSRKLPDGTTVPLGKPVKNPSLVSTLLYNEYVIYNEDQVDVQYLLKIRFIFK